MLRHLPALRERNFALFISGHFLSLIGTAMQNTVQPLVAYHLSNSRFDLGLIGFALTLPTFFFALPAGVLVEHLEKRKVVIAMQTIMMLQAFLLAWLTWSRTIRISHLVWLSLLLGIASTVEITARQAMLSELASVPALPNAIALQSMAFNLSRAFGPSLATILLLSFPEHGEALVFFLNGVSFLFVLGSLFAIRKSNAHLPAPRHSFHFREEIAEGAQYLLHHLTIRRIVFLAGIMGLLAFPVVQQIPAIARELLSAPGTPRAVVDARSSAIYTAQGFGALTASLLLSLFSLRIQDRERWAAIGQLAYLLAVLIIAFAPPFPLALLLVFLMGWGSVTQLALSNTVIQTGTPDELRGRVFSIYLWAIQGITPFGSLLIGYLAQRYGLPLTLRLVALLCLSGMAGVKRGSARPRDSLPG